MMMAGELKTSAEWHSLLEGKYKGSCVIDADGWKRDNIEYAQYYVTYWDDDEPKEYQCEGV
jgi:hypothetical protein